MKLTHILVLLPFLQLVMGQRKDTRFHCNERCMNESNQCRNKCKLARLSRAFCDGGVLPNTCQACCQHKDTGCYCDKSCMMSIDICKEECPVSNDKGRTYCTDLGRGWDNIPERASIPCACAKCCRGCKNVDRPEKVKICVSECTLRKWGTFYKDCLEDFSEEIKTTCVKACKALEEYASSPDDCKPLLDCQAKCCTKTSQNYFYKCREKYDEDESNKCVEECVGVPI